MKCRILMVGASLEAKGGISNVIQGYYNNGLMDRFNIDYIPTHFLGTKIIKIKKYIESIIKIICIIKKYFIVHLHTASYWSYRRLFIVLIISKIFKKRAIIHLHGGNFCEYFNNAVIFEKLIIKIGFHIADSIICLTPQIRNNISKFSDIKKIHILANCVHVINKTTLINYIKKRRDQKYILFMGDIIERKGVFDLLLSVNSIKNNNSHVRLIICGNGDSFKLHNLIKEYGLENNVVYNGWVDGHDKQKLIENAYIFVLPSYIEGLPMSILEAMGYGIPIVSTNVGGIPYAVENGKQGFLSYPGIVNDLSNNLRTLLSNNEIWNEMSMSAREKAEHFFNDKDLIGRLKKIYEI